MEGPYPDLSLDEVQFLILSLYQPNSPQIIADAQACLSRFQCSSQAWTMIQDLLQCPDENVKFFGALTVIIKLNKESSALNNEDATELLIRLVGWYIRSLVHSDSPLVLRKLSSAIGTHFIHFHHLWPLYLRHIVLCLACGQSLNPIETREPNEFTSALGGLCPRRLQAAVWVVTCVMEDASRIDLSAGNKSLYEAILRNVPEAEALVTKCLSSDSTLTAVSVDSLRCIQAWISFAQKSSSGLTHDTLSLRPLVEAVILSLSDKDTFEASAELLVDILTNCPLLLTSEHYDNLSKQFGALWAVELYRKLLRGDFDSESMQFGQLLLAFGEARTEALIQSNDEINNHILSALCGLLTVHGYPLTEDKIFVSAVEFWSTYTEAVADIIHFGSSDEVSNARISGATSHVSKAVFSVWQKIIYPPPEMFQQWDSSDRAGFNDARQDVLDLLQSAHTVLGPRLIASFADLVLSALESSAWLPLEAATFCLGGLAECGKGDGRFDDALTSVFASPLTSILQSRNPDIDLRARQTCFYLIDQYAEYFERNTALLGPVLRLLFGVLSHQSTAASASRSILLLCSSCRHHLHPQIDEFLRFYSDKVVENQLDCVSNEKVLGAIASIAQAIPNAERRHGVCMMILEFVQSDVAMAQAVATSAEAANFRCQLLRCPRVVADEDAATHTGLRALKCLVSVGKGYQSPSDVTIDIESGNQQDEVIGDALPLIHDKLMGIIVQLQHTFPSSSEVMELVCSVFRCGFSEADPGPFALQPEVVAMFLTGNGGETQRIGFFVGTACSLVSSVRCNNSPKRQSILASLLLWVVSLLRQLPDPGYDPELSQNGIELASRILARAPLVVIGLQPAEAAEFLLMFTIKVLDGKEPLPKGAAAEFWTAFVSLKSDDSNVEPAMRRAMQTLGPMLAQSLARNIGGNASRSELDKLSEPLKKLVVRHPMAKEWLQLGLSHHSFPSSQVTSEQKVLLVKKIISLRGSRATNQVIREFWLSSRGSNFAYAS